MADRLFAFFWSKSSVANDMSVDAPLNTPSTDETRVETSQTHSHSSNAESPSPSTTAAILPSPQIDLTSVNLRQEKSLASKPAAQPKKPRKRKSKAALDGPPSPMKPPPSPSSTILSLSAPAVTNSNQQAQDFETGMEQALTDLLRSIPAKTLHDYLTAHLKKLPPSELISLSNILCELEPPPVRHCVRCHKDFTDVENDDRSCLVAHDDNSAVVQYASRNRNTGGMKGHETFWGCCGNTVDGEGEMGPPSGWCYEGMHTVDRRRARFRDDSTPQDDRLLSCEVIGCRRKCTLGPQRQTRGRGTKRLRDPDEGSEQEISDTEVSHNPVKRKSTSPSAFSVRSTRSVRRRVNSPAISMYSARRRSPSLTPSIEVTSTNVFANRDSPKKKRSEMMKSRSKSVNPSENDRKATDSSISYTKQTLKAKQTIKNSTANRILSEADAEGESVKVGKSKKRRLS